MANLNIRKFLDLTFFLFICSLILGQLARLPLSSFFGAVFLSDFLLLLLVLFWLALTAVKRKIILPPATQLVIIFIMLAIISLINSLRFFAPAQLLPGLFLLIRYSAYFLLYLIVANVVSTSQRQFWLNLLVIVSLTVAILGFIQLLILPDLTFLTIYGWDPHLNRLASTFLDPNFVGAFLVMGLILAQSLYLQSKKLWLAAASALLLIAAILTFSRSSYLMLAVSLSLFAILKSRKMVFVLVFFLVLLIVAFPRAQSRIGGAVKLDPTAQARIISWQNAVIIFKDNIFLGVGFNNYRLAQAKYGFFEVATPLGGHSGAGSDSSFLTVAATTGLTGLFIYLLLYLKLISANFVKRSKPIALASFITLVSLIFHSQFVNSLFYPAIMAWVWIINGLAYSDE